MLSYVGFTSATHLVFIGIERLIAIMWPLHHPSIVTEKSLAIAIYTAWLTPASLVPGLLYVIKTIETYQDRIRIRDYNYGLCLGIFCVFTITLCGIYGKIYHDARAQVNKVQAMTSTRVSHQNTTQTASNNKALKMVLVILLAFLLLDCPYVVHGTLKLFGVDPDGNNPAIIILEAVSFVFIQSNSVVNVAVYAAFSPQFRRAYIIVLCCYKHNIHSSESITESTS
jgi:hypothetical protein